MTKITKFDKPILRQIRTDLEKLLELFAESRDIELKVGNCRFDASTFTFKLHGVTIGNDGVAETTEVKDLAAYYPHYVGKEVTLHGRTATVSGTVIGFKRRGRKFPFQVKAEDGKTYKVSENQIR